MYRAMKRIKNSTPIKKVMSAMLRDDPDVADLFAAYLLKYQIKQDARVLVKGASDGSEVLRSEGGLIAKQAL